MTMHDVLKTLRWHSPQTAQEVLDYCQLPLQYVGGGAYRDVYQVIGTSLVLKIPRKLNNTPKSYRKCILHSRNEFKVWRNILKSKRKYVALQKYMPEIIYHNTYTGLTMMRLYKSMEPNATGIKIAQQISELVFQVTGVKWCDVHSQNLGVGADGGLIITDLGYLVKES